VHGGLLLGALEISLRLMRGQPADLGLLLSGMRRLGALFLQGIVTYLGVALAAFLALVPILALLFGLWEASLPIIGAACLMSLLASLLFLYVSLGVSFSVVELVAQPQVGPFTAIQNSWRIVSGRRLNVLLAFLGLGALVVAGTLACLVGLVFTLGFGILFYTGVYLALRNGQETNAVS